MRNTFAKGQDWEWKSYEGNPIPSALHHFMTQAVSYWSSVPHLPTFLGWGDGLLPPSGYATVDMRNLEVATIMNHMDTNT